MLQTENHDETLQMLIRLYREERQRDREEYQELKGLVEKHHHSLYGVLENNGMAKDVITLKESTSNLDERIGKIVTKRISVAAAVLTVILVLLTYLRPVG